MSTLALVGGSHIHTPNFVKKMAEADGIDTKYVWDPSRETAEARQAVAGGQIVDDPQTIYDDPAVDAVVICSQTDLHEKLAIPAAEAGKHLFIEKPLGFAAGDAERIAEAVERAGVIFQTGFFMRGNPQIRFVREAIQSGKLGKVTRVRLSNCHSGSLGGWFDTEWRWMADPQRAGCGAFGDLGAHALDLLLWFMDNDPAETATSHVGVATGRYGACDEFGEGLVRFGSGAVGSIAASWVDVADPHKLQVSGTEGHLWVTQNKLYAKSEHIDGGDGETPLEDLGEPWPHAFDLFLQAVQGQQDVPLIGVREAAQRSVVMEAMYQGAGQGLWQAVRPGAAARA